MTLAKPTSQCTQMILLKNVSVQYDLRDKKRGMGRVWWRAIKILQQSPGFVRVYFGRRVEIPDTVHLHVGKISSGGEPDPLPDTDRCLVRKSLEHNQTFLNSPQYKEFTDLINNLTNEDLTIRHAYIAEYNPGCESLGKGAPVTGTAIYLDLADLWDERWDLWTTIVPKVDGFMGIAGGPLVEPVQGYKDCFIALVGWKNVEVHDAYHHTQDFADKRDVLLDPGRSKKKFTEYGHIAFESDLVVDINSKL